MKKLLPLTLLLLLCSLAFGQGMVGNASMVGTASAIGGINGSPPSPPTLITTDGATGFASSYTLNMGTVNTGDWIVYLTATNASTTTFTPADDCNTGGTSDTNVYDIGPETDLTQGALGHFVVGLGRTNCTITITLSAGSGTIVAAVLRGVTTGVDKLSPPTALNYQAGLSSGTNNVTSGTAVTTTHTDLCVAGTINENVGGGTITTGTNIAWTTGSTAGSYPSANEYFTQSSAGSIQATFSYSTTGWMATGMGCYY